MHRKSSAVNCHVTCYDVTYIPHVSVTCDEITYYDFKYTVVNCDEVTSDDNIQLTSWRHI